MPDYSGIVIGSDNCDVQPVITQNSAAGSVFTPGMNMVITAKDISGNSADTINILAGFHLSDNFRVICTYNKSFENVVIPDTFGLVLNYRMGKGFE